MGASLILPCLAVAYLGDGTTLVDAHATDH